MATHIFAGSSLKFWTGIWGNEEPQPASQASPLWRLIFSQTHRENPRVLFIPTASGDDPTYIRLFREAFTNFELEHDVLPLFTSFDLSSLDEFVSGFDAIFVGGGNTASMLAVWRRHGVDSALLKAYENGTVICGASAGGLCWWEGGSTDSFGKPVRPITDCLGWVKGFFAPHYDSEADRRPLLQSWVKSGVLESAYASDDGTVIHIQDGVVQRAYSEIDGKLAYFVARNSEGGVVESALETVLLCD